MNEYMYLVTRKDVIPMISTREYVSNPFMFHNPCDYLIPVGITTDYIIYCVNRSNLIGHEVAGIIDILVVSQKHIAVKKHAEVGDQVLHYFGSHLMCAPIMKVMSYPMSVFRKERPELLEELYKSYKVEYEDASMRLLSLPRRYSSTIQSLLIDKITNRLIFVGREVDYQLYLDRHKDMVKPSANVRPGENFFMLISGYNKDILSIAIHNGGIIFEKCFEYETEAILYLCQRGICERLIM